MFFWRLPSRRSSAAIKPLVSVPCSRSKGCTGLNCFSGLEPRARRPMIFAGAAVRVPTTPRFATARCSLKPTLLNFMRLPRFPRSLTVFDLLPVPTAYELPRAIGEMLGLRPNSNCDFSVFPTRLDSGLTLHESRGTQLHQARNLAGVGGYAVED